MCAFVADHLMSDDQLRCSSLGKTASQSQHALVAYGSLSRVVASIHVSMSIGVMNRGFRSQKHCIPSPKRHDGQLKLIKPIKTTWHS